MITRYKTIDRVSVITLVKDDIFEWDGQVYTVALDAEDDGAEIAVCVIDEMDDKDILWIGADEDVDLLQEDFD